jgi:hypothetical protein
MHLPQSALHHSYGSNPHAKGTAAKQPQDDAKNLIFDISKFSKM